MSLPIQMIHVHYKGKYLALLDSDDRTPLYQVKVCRESPQMEMVRLPSPETNSFDPARFADSLCTATFSALSFEVKLNIHGRLTVLKRDNFAYRASHFESAGAGSGLQTLYWEPDGLLTGDYKLLDGGKKVLARFRNKVFSVAEVGSFELVGDMTCVLKDEIVISGLALLTMVQSLSLCGMVLLGGGKP